MNKARFGIATPLCAACSDGAARREREWLQRVRLRAARGPGPAVHRRPIPDALGGRCTTSQRKTHITEAEVLYPWHPLFGRTVVVHRSLVRRDRAVFQCGIDDGKQIEIPQWMFDRAICCTTRQGDSPIVGCDDLRRLRALLLQTRSHSTSNVIQDQHLDSFLKGDADVHHSQSSPRGAVAPVRSPSPTTDVGISADRSPEEGHLPGGTTVAGTSPSNERNGGP